MEKYRIVNCLTINQDDSLLVVSSNLGIVVFQLDDMKEAYQYEDDGMFMKNVRKAVAYFRTNMYAMIAMASDESVSVNSLYIFDGQKKKVVNTKTINSMISNVEYIEDGIMFCGFDEIYLCDISTLKPKRVLKTSANVGQCLSLVFNQDRCLLAHRHTRPNLVNILNIKNELSDTQFQPYEEEVPVSFIKMSSDVSGAHARAS